jgi:hypothetical protein
MAGQSQMPGRTGRFGFSACMPSRLRSKTRLGAFIA